MSSVMILHVAFRSEAEAAPFRTGERTFVVVDEHMSLQILLLRKCFITLVAFERLRSIMNVHMSSVPI